MLKTAAGRRFLIQGQGGKIFGKLIIGDMFGKLAKMQADQCDAANVVVKGALALSPQNNLLLKGFVNLAEAINSLNGFFNDSGFRSFFS
jgi:hypothetical protein